LYPDTETVRRLYPSPKNSKGLKAKGSVNKKNGSLEEEKTQQSQKAPRNLRDLGRCDRCLPYNVVTETKRRLHTKSGSVRKLQAKNSNPPKDENYTPLKVPKLDHSTWLKERQAYYTAEKIRLDAELNLAQKMIKRFQLQDEFNIARQAIQKDKSKSIAEKVNQIAKITKPFKLEDTARKFTCRVARKNILKDWKGPDHFILEEG